MGMTGMVVCPECGLWFFNRAKLDKHLTNEHGCPIKGRYIAKEEEDAEQTRPSKVV